MLTSIALSAATIAITIGAICAIGVVVWGAWRWPGRVFQVLMSAIVFASISIVVLSNRVLALKADLLAEEESAQAGEWVTKIPLAIVIGLSFSVCFAWFISARHNPRVRLRAAEAGGMPPTDLIFVFLAHVVAFSILPIFFGQYLVFRFSLIYPFFVFLALLLWVQVSVADPVIIVKQCCFLLVSGSLVAAVIAPSLSLQPDYGVGLIPAFSSRLWGITQHANALGAVASVLLILELAEASKRKWIRWTVIISASAALLMSQSKTSILAVLIGMLVLFGWRIAEQVRAEVRTSKTRSSGTLTTLVAAGCAALAMIGLWLLIADDPLPTALLAHANPRAVSNMTTVTGRTYIWEAAVDSGMENPLFGQGAGMWDLDNRLRLGLHLAYHAHNLFLEAFSRSGLVGLLTLCVFLYVLLRYGIRAAINTRGGTLAVMAVFLARSITEVPLRPASIFPADFFAFAGLLFYLMDRGIAPRRRKSVCDGHASRATLGGQRTGASSLQG